MKIVTMMKNNQKDRYRGVYLTYTSMKRFR